VVFTVKVAGALGVVELSCLAPEAEALRKKTAEIRADANKSPARKKPLFIESPTSLAMHVLFFEARLMMTNEAANGSLHF
jgi:hypothetical protein